MADGCMHDAMRGRRMLTSLARQPGALQGEGGDMAVKRCGVHRHRLCMMGAWCDIRSQSGNSTSGHGEWHVPVWS